MASFQLFSGDPGEADRPDRKAVIKVKIPNLPSSLHPESSVQNFPFYTRFFLSCQRIYFPEFPEFLGNTVKRSKP
jgi:hypothetical protein